MTVLDAGTLVLDQPVSWCNELSGAVVAPWEVPGGDPVLTDGGYTHAVVRVREWENRNACFFLDWQARCGRTGTATGSLTLGTTPLDAAHRMVRLMACRGCWDLPRGGRPVPRARS